jgi:hypothetical protein
MTVGDLALAQLPAAALDGEIVARVDGAGATHEFTAWCRDANIAFSVGGAVTQDILTEALIIADQAWQQALCQDGSDDDDAWVAELTGRLAGKLATWPAGTRLVCRAVRLAEGAQLGFGQTDGFRYEVFLTDRGGDIRDLDLFQREHARVEDRIRDAKDLGLRNLPFQSFACNEVWLLLSGLAQDLLAWSQQLLLLTGDLARAEPQTLRYRLWHIAAKIARHARRLRLRLDRHWPWADQLATAFTRLHALGAPRTT